MILIFISYIQTSLALNETVIKHIKCKLSLLNNAKKLILIYRMM